MRDESGFRRPKYRQGTLAVLLLVGLSGCASQSGQTFATLDRNHPQFHSEQCQAAIRDTEIHDDIKILRAIASPVAVILVAVALVNRQVRSFKMSSKAQPLVLRPVRLGLQ